MADVIEDDAAVSSDVLQFYSLHAPQKLSTVVLESGLTIVPRQALGLMEDVIGANPTSTGAADLFARALLYLVCE